MTVHCSVSQMGPGIPQRREQGSRSFDRLPKLSTGNSQVSLARF